MFPSLHRTVIVAVVGALAGATALVVAYGRHPELRLEMDQDLPRITSGFYPVEVVRDGSFAWTSRSAVVRLPGADRRAPWKCSIRFRGGRSAPLEQPVVDLAVDGISLASRTASNEYQVLEVTAPSQSSRTGLTLTITSSTTFVPGPADRRELGVQVDALACVREARGIAIPPRRALTAATTSAGVLGAAFALIAQTLGPALAGTVLLGAVQAMPLAAGPAPYSAYEERAAPLAVWIALAAVAVKVLAERWRRVPLSPAAKFVVAFSAGALFVELLALLHPSKAIVDALFHAHRLQWVLGGRYYFTQPMPDGVQFPYAIALYVFSMPWAAFTQDHVTLLRVVVCTAHAGAGALLYPAVARAWDDRVGAAAAVVLFHVVPLPYIVIGNANLTYAFGQSAAFVTLAAVALSGLHRHRAIKVGALTLLAALAFLSHVGVFPVLLMTLLLAAALFRAVGGEAMRALAGGVFIAAAAAAVFSVVTYYGQFGEVYRSLDRVTGRTSAASTTHAAETAATGSTTPAATIPLAQRAATVAMLAARAFGWPVLVLAAAGTWQVWRRSARDRLTLILAAGAVTYAVFVAFAALTPVEPRFQKYSDEFIDRMNYAAVPLIVVAAGRAASLAWHAGAAPRIIAVLLLSAAAVKGVQHWNAWFR